MTTEFITLLKKGDISIVKTYYDDNEINIHDNNDEYFKIAISNGYFKIAKWIYKNKKQNIDFCENNYEIFELAVRSGNLKIVKWLLDLNDRIFIHYN